MFVEVTHQTHADELLDRHRGMSDSTVPLFES
jgi:hypothetical protein